MFEFTAGVPILVQTMRCNARWSMCQLRDGIQMDGVAGAFVARLGVDDYCL